MTFSKDRKRELELEVLNQVKALCESEPDSTVEKIHVDALRQRAERWLALIGKGPCK